MHFIKICNRVADKIKIVRAKQSVRDCEQKSTIVDTNQAILQRTETRIRHLDSLNLDFLFIYNVIFNSVLCSHCDMKRYPNCSARETSLL